MLHPLAQSQQPLGNTRFVNSSVATLSRLQERGSALVISLVVLTAITMGAMVAMQRSTLQTRMIGNMQHQQAIFNATYSNINHFYQNLERPQVATRILGDIITKELALDVNTPIGSIKSQPYSNDYQHLIAPPPMSKGVARVDNELRMLRMTTSGSLKEHAGSSTGTEVPYYFASNAQGMDGSNNTRSRQEMGFRYMAPAPQQ